MSSEARTRRVILASYKAGEAMALINSIAKIPDVSALGLMRDDEALRKHVLPMKLDDLVFEARSTYELAFECHGYHFRFYQTNADALSYRLVIVKDGLTYVMSNP